MTQKSVSIRANVSIRGITIRVYALYKIRVWRDSAKIRFGQNFFGQNFFGQNLIRLKLDSAKSIPPKLEPAELVCK